MNKEPKIRHRLEFRDRAVPMIISSEKSAAQIAKDLGIKATTLYAWVNKSQMADTKTGINQTNEQLFDEL